jgi:DNA-binding IclR family transcriptional regulator
MTRHQIIGNSILKHQGFFSLDQIVRETKYRRDDARQALAGFVKEGLIREIRRRKKSQYRGGAAPLIISYGVINRKKLAEKIIPKYRGQNNASDRVWFVIRKKKIFTRRDICVLAGVSKSQVRWYTKMLARAGYIKSSGRSGEWTLIKNPGPRRPYVGDQIKRPKAIGTRR